MIGLDFVTFFDDFTVRAESGYFTTNDDLDKMVDEINYVPRIYMDVEASYVQYVLQVEYAGFSDVNLGLQLLGTDVLDASGMTFGATGTTDLTKDNFTPGMGTPFAMIAEKAVIVNGSTSLFDNRLDLEAMSLVNLDETGYLIGINADYSPFENWKFNIGINKFIGDDEDPDNHFSQMEDFSHVSLGLEFNF